jgi:alkylation response protein AidB-like acyl-CoA dehydrogenase
VPARTTRAGPPAPPTRSSATAPPPWQQAFAADELYTVGASLIQVHGGIGFTWEHDAHLYYKRLLTLKELAGGSPGQLEELASLVLDSG